MHGDREQRLTFRSRVEAKARVQSKMGLSRAQLVQTGSRWALLEKLMNRNNGHVRVLL